MILKIFQEKEAKVDPIQPSLHFAGHLFFVLQVPTFFEIQDASPGSGISLLHRLGMQQLAILTG